MPPTVSTFIHCSVLLHRYDVFTFFVPCTYLYRCCGLARVIDANFPIFAHRGQELAIWAPCHTKHLNIIQKTGQQSGRSGSGINSETYSIINSMLKANISSCLNNFANHL